MSAVGLAFRHCSVSCLSAAFVLCRVFSGGRERALKAASISRSDCARPHHGSCGAGWRQRSTGSALEHRVNPPRQWCDSAVGKGPRAARLGKAPASREMHTMSSCSYSVWGVRCSQPCSAFSNCQGWLQMEVREARASVRCGALSLWPLSCWVARRKGIWAALQLLWPACSLLYL